MGYIYYAEESVFSTSRAEHRVKLCKLCVKEARNEIYILRRRVCVRHLAAI